MPKARIVIAANYTADPVGDVMRFWLDTWALPYAVAFAPFDQLFQQLLDPASDFSRNAGGINVVLVKLDDWMHAEGAGTAQRNPLQRNVSDLVDALSSAARRTGTPILVVSCPASPDVRRNAAAAAALSAADASLTEGLADVGGVYLVTADQIDGVYPVGRYYDADSERLGAIPYQPAYFAALATAIVRRVRALHAAPYKVLVLDCDNTLWRGVCGEAGTTGVVIDDALQAFQHFVLAQQDAGMVICLSSKNEEADVRDVFDSRRDMVLTWDHVVAARINWQPKSANLKALATELNLGLDSFVFIDDSPYEVEEVRANCPEVLALQLPTDATDIQSFVKHTWAFDRLTVTAEDRRRSGSYKANVLRESVRRESSDLDGYLRSLELRVDISAPTDGDFARIAQMTQRTNQFNVSTIRRDEAEIRRLCATEELSARMVSVRDRFGDYGIVGLMLFAHDGTALRVDTMLLSCRALGRRVEHAMISELGRYARSAGLERVNVPFIRTRKNTPALEFLESLAPSAGELPNEHLFSFPTEAAITAVDRVTSVSTAASPVSEDASATTSASATAVDTALLMTRIHRELASADRILEAARRLRGRRSVNHEREIVEPRSRTEQLVVRLWRDALDIERISIRDNYFDIGGTSLHAVAIFAALRREFGEVANPAILFSAPTVEQLAAALSGRDVPVDEPRPWRSLIPIQPRGSLPPLFCFHAGAGSVLFYYPLARALGNDQPLFALQPVGFYDAEAPHASVAAMVDSYIREIRAVRPSGPYNLAGFCFGATLAFEVARRLEADGETVQCVAAFDGKAPGFAERGAMPLSYQRDTASFIGRRWAQLTARGRGIRFRALRAYTRRFGGPVPPMLRRFSWYFPTNIAIAGDVYRPGSYGGSMEVFTIEGRYKDPTLGWQRWVGGAVRPHLIAGEFDRHRDLLEEPMVSDVANALGPLLAAARDTSSRDAFAPVAHR